MILIGIQKLPSSAREPRESQLQEPTSQRGTTTASSRRPGLEPTWLPSTASRCSWPLRKPKHGPGSVTGGRPEVALDRGRRLLDSMPYPENLDNHFVVDPTKFDFYAMDCYRHLAEDRMAETLADEVIRSATDFDGTERAPMRLAEARVTLGVVAARQGDVERAIHHGEQALEGQRKSLPSLAMVSRDLTRVLRQKYPQEPTTKVFLEQLQVVGHTADLGRQKS